MTIFDETRIEDFTTDELLQIALNLMSDEGDLDFASQSHDAAVTYAVINNPNTAMGTLLAIAQSIQHDGLDNVQGYDYLGTMDAAVQALEARWPGIEYEENCWEFESDALAFLAAKNPETPHEQLAVLAGTPIPAVALAVIDNPNTRLGTLLALTKGTRQFHPWFGDCSEVAEAATNRLAFATIYFADEKKGA